MYCLTLGLCIKITPSGRGGRSCTTLTLFAASAGDLAREKDPAKIHELMNLLRAVVKEDQEEVRIRVKFLAKTYGHFLSDSQAAD
jgi:hypothetical protein